MVEISIGKLLAPVWEAVYFFSDRRDDQPNAPSSYIRRHCLKLSFDGRALLPDSQWTSTVVELFDTLAKRLNAFYAACYVIRDAGLEQSNVVYLTGKTESYSISRGPWWVGLSTIPTWLTWFGPGYAELVAPHLNDCQFVKESTPAGIFLQMGPEQMNRDQLGDYPALPDSLKRLDYKMHAEIIPQVDLN